MFLNSKSKLRLKRMEVYKNDVRLTYTQESKRPTSGGKKKQKMLSAKSVKRLAFYAQNTGVQFTDFLTLTYPRDFPTNGKEVKRHLNTFLSWLRSANSGLEYLWFLEFQKRGAPHFHIMVNVDMVSRKKEVSIRWYETVQSGDVKHLKAGTNTQRIRKSDGAARYTAKYASKQYQKVVPDDYRDVGRFWGCSSGVPPKPEQTFDISGMTGEQIQEAFRVLGWEYYESLTKPLSILYNASKFTRQE